MSIFTDLSLFILLLNYKFSSSSIQGNLFVLFAEFLCLISGERTFSTCPFRSGAGLIYEAWLLSGSIEMDEKGEFIIFTDGASKQVVV